jgi:hypothetical protein
MPCTAKTCCERRKQDVIVFFIDDNQGKNPLYHQIDGLAS